jgi:hypothetical protein
MTLDDAIKLAEELAEENQRIVDTGIVSDDISIDMLYCDDTEVIEEHLTNYQRCAEQHRQLAEWLKDYKRLKEQEPMLDKIRAKIEKKIIKRPWLDFEDRERDRNDAFLEVLDIIDKYKANMENNK